MTQVIGFRCWKALSPAMAITALGVVGVVIWFPNDVPWSLLLQFGSVLLALVGAFWFGRRSLAPSLLQVQEHLQAAGLGRAGERIDPARLPSMLKGVVQGANELLRRDDDLVLGLRHLSGNVAHELALPISVMLRHHEQAAPGDKGFDEHYAQLGDQLMALQLMFNSLLDIVELEAGSEVKLVAVDLADAVRECLLLFEDTAEERGVRFETQLNSVQVMGNYWLLLQAFNNLISNAIRFSPEAQCIRVTTGVDGAQPFFDIADEGPGTPEATIDELLVRVTRRRKQDNSINHGLGLRLVRATMIRHGARMEIVPAKGLRWRIGFPAYEAIIGRRVNPGGY